MSVTPISKTEQDKLMAAVEQMRRAMPGIIEYRRLDAKIKRAAFLAFKSEGFTDAEALQLTMHDPLRS